MKPRKIILLSILFALLLSVGANAAGKNMVDDAKVLKQDTINTVEENLGKIKKNTDVTVKFDIIKSLKGKSIDDYATQYAKDNISGDQYILFVTSVDDKKNKLLIGSKANNILSKSDIDDILALPNSDYKANNFDAGIIKVGKAIDEKVTSKAIKVGNAEVVNDGYSKKVAPKSNYLGTIIIILIIGVILFIFIKRKINNDYEKRKRKFAQDNNLDYEDNSFHSADVGSNKSKNYSSSNDNSNSYSSDTNRDTNSRMYDSSYTPHNNTTINNTTIIHDNNDNKFVEGMMVGSMLSDSDHHHHDHHNYNDQDYERAPERLYNNEYRKDSEKPANNESSSYTSGKWDDNSTSSWDSSNDSSSNSDSNSSDW